jgi:flagellin
MRSQIRGLDKASSNAQDGISLIQTAEGALNESHSILQRMNELAVQGANDTNETIDRDAINEELDALTSELDRIASTTQFNKQNLIDGSFSSKNLQVGANSDQKISLNITAMNAKALGLKDIAGLTSQSQSGSKVTGFTFGAYSYALSQGDISGKSIDSWKDIAKSQIHAQISAKQNEAAYVLQTDGSTGSAYYINAQKSTDGSNKRYSTAAAALQADMSVLSDQLAGAFSTRENAMRYADTTTTNASVNTVGEITTLSHPDVSNYAKANATVDAIQKAINRVSSQRSALGALQNRLEHTVANLDNVSENTSSAESRIRDTDMASEMVIYSKNNILAQAGQSMLAQANQSTQGVLSLLQ